MSLQEITGSSLAPYAVTQFTPVLPLTVSATLSVTGVAHHITYRSDDKSYFSSSGCEASAKAIGATAISTVIRSVSIWRSIWSMSNRRCSRIQAPVSIAIAMLRSPRMCDGGVMICMRSADDSRNASRQCRTATANAPWVWRTALGMPVVPELKTNNASDSGGGGCEGSLTRRDGFIQRHHGHQLGEHRIVADGVRRLGQRERMLDLCALPCRADQDRRRAQQPDGPQREDEFGSIGRHERDPVTRPHTAMLESGRHATGQGVEFRQRVLTLLESERDRLTHSLSSLAAVGLHDAIENSVSFIENDIL